MTSRDAYAILRDDFPEAAALAEESDASLVGWNIARVYARMLFDAIDEIEAREARPDGARFLQLFHFEYIDSARMVTVGGILVAPGLMEVALAAWSIDVYPFVRTARTLPYTIDLPRLTHRESQWLNQFLPASNGEEPVPEDDRRRYASLYRWFPTFAEIEF
jgi:hypothetical protein